MTYTPKNAGLREQPFLYQLHSRWLPSCDYFFQRVGKEMVPSDIHYANQDVRINLGFPLVLWSPILCLAKDENGQLYPRAPANVDNIRTEI